MRISDWSSDVCSSDLSLYGTFDERSRIHDAEKGLQLFAVSLLETSQGGMGAPPWDDPERYLRNSQLMHVKDIETPRSEEHTSELQSLMRISYAVFCLKKKNRITNQTSTNYKIENT